MISSILVYQYGVPVESAQAVLIPVLYLRCASKQQSSQGSRRSQAGGHSALYREYGLLQSAVQVVQCSAEQYTAIKVYKRALTMDRSTRWSNKGIQYALRCTTEKFGLL